MLFRRHNGIFCSCDYIPFSKMLGLSSYFEVYTVPNVQIWRFFNSEFQNFPLLVTCNHETQRWHFGLKIYLINLFLRKATILVNISIYYYQIIIHNKHFNAGIMQTWEILSIEPKTNFTWIGKISLAVLVFKWWGVWALFYRAEAFRVNQ